MKKSIWVTLAEVFVEIALWAFLVVLIYNLSGCSHTTSEMQPEAKIISWFLPSD